MSNHPIIPPPELVEELQDLGNLDAIALAYQSGADQELEACCEWLRGEYDWGLAAALRLDAERRPEPPSLKEQALEALERMQDQYPHLKNKETIREALESL